MAVASLIFVMFTILMNEVAAAPTMHSTGKLIDPVHHHGWRRHLSADPQMVPAAQPSATTPLTYKRIYVQNMCRCDDIELDVSFVYTPVLPINQDADKASKTVTLTSCRKVLAFNTQVCPAAFSVFLCLNSMSWVIFHSTTALQAKQLHAPLRRLRTSTGLPVTPKILIQAHQALKLSQLLILSEAPAIWTAHLSTRMPAVISKTLRCRSHVTPWPVEQRKVMRCWRGLQ